MEHIFRNDIKKRKRPQHNPTFALSEDSTSEGLIPSKRRAHSPRQSDLPGPQGRLQAIATTAETSLQRSWKDTIQATSLSPGLRSPPKRPLPFPRPVGVTEAATEISRESRLERLRELRSKVRKNRELRTSEGLSRKPSNPQISTLNPSNVSSKTSNKSRPLNKGSLRRPPEILFEQPSLNSNGSQSQRPTVNLNEYPQSGGEPPPITIDNGPEKLPVIISEPLGLAHIEDRDKSSRSPDRTLQFRTTIHYTISEDYTNEGRAVKNRLCALSDKRPTAATERKDGDGDGGFTLNLDTLAKETAFDDGLDSMRQEMGRLSPGNVLDDFDFDAFLADDHGTEPFDFDGTGFNGTLEALERTDR